MKKKEVFVLLTECIHGSKITPCNEYCPFELNVRDIMAKIKKGSFIAAFNIYRDTVLFPELVCRLCPAPCLKKCDETLDGDGVDLKRIERFLSDSFLEKDPVNYGIPSNGKKVAVLGSGLSAMSAALKFSQNGYVVSIFEKKDVLCPEISSKFGESLVSHGILRQFKYASCDMQTGCSYDDLDTGAFDFVIDTESAVKDADNVFRIVKNDFEINGIQQGINLFRQIDWFVKTGNLKDLEPLYAESIPPELIGSAGISEDPLDKPAAREMAGKCTGCDCSKCMEACTMLKDYGNGILDLNRAVGLTLNLFEHVDTREGTRQISGCTDCGLCKELCPKGIDIGAFLMDAKRQIFEQGVIPHAYHDYWLRDHAFAQSDAAFVFHMPGGKSSEYLFFPGCQAGASDPRYVSMTYELMLRTHPGSSLLLGCCGAPVKWTGDEIGTEKAHEEIRKYWEKAGRPVIVTICPSCYRILKDSFEDAEVKMLYEVLDFGKVPELPFEKATVFDPCSSRHYPDMQLKIREISKAAGITLEESRYSGKETQCCSYGNHIYDVKRDMVEEQVKERISDSELPYIVYCTNCRDIFASRGKEVRHVLDLILGINKEERGVPTLQQRRQNRYELKKELIEKYSIPAEQGELPSFLTLDIEDKIQKKMDDNLILLEDISEVIRTAEENGTFLINDEGHRFAHLLRGIITYWTEYAPDETGYKVFNVYSHRINIKGEK